MRIANLVDCPCLCFIMSRSYYSVSYVWFALSQSTQVMNMDLRLWIMVLNSLQWKWERDWREKDMKRWKWDGGDRRRQWEAAEKKQWRRRNSERTVSFMKVLLRFGLDRMSNMVMAMIQDFTGALTFDWGLVLNFDDVADSILFFPYN